MIKQDYILNLVGKELTEIVETLNYSSIICKCKEQDYDKLLNELKKDNCNHLHRMKYVKNNGLFYIENCDLQDITYEDLLYYINEENYVIKAIRFTDNGFILNNTLLEEVVLSEKIICQN